MECKNLASEIADRAVLAALLEVGTEKPGSVTPSKSFNDLSYSDFFDAALVMREPLKLVAERGISVSEGSIDASDICVGKCIYDAFQPTTTNVNFGIVLMFSPLAAAAGYSLKGNGLRKSLESVIKAANSSDTLWIYKAMRKTNLGGMELKDESLRELDVFSDSALDKIEQEQIGPLELFSRCKDDKLAEEWSTGLELCFQKSKEIVLSADGIRKCYLEILAENPDTFIARKACLRKAEEASERACDVLEGRLREDELDAYLRSEGNLLNPGTTADLTATSIFIRLLENKQ